MSKQKVFTLDAQDTLDYYDDMLENTAVLMWNTRYSAYTFAFFLNRLYGLYFKPDSDINFDCGKQHVDCSVFSYHNDIEKLSYFFVDNSADTMLRIKDLSYFDKVLLISGPGSFEKAESIFDDIRSNEASNSDMMTVQREETRRCFVDSGVVEIDTFDFSDPDNPSTSFLANAAPGTSLYKKQQKFLKFQKDYFQCLFVAIDGLIRDFG